MKRKKLIVIVVLILFFTVEAIIILCGKKYITLTHINNPKQNYDVKEYKEKIEQQIHNLKEEQENKGETLKITDLPKINNEEIDVRSVQQFPVKVLCNGHKFEIDSNFNINYIEDTDETIVTYTTEPKGYTNQDNVQILVMINNSKGIKSIQKPESNNIIYVYGKNKVVIDYDVVSNGTYIFKVTDVDGKEISKDVVIDQIDKIEPKNVEIECKPGIRSTTIEINAKDSDKIDNSTKSGIDKYEIFLNNQKIGETSENRYRITNLNKNIEYSAYVIAYDKAGNYKQSEMTYFTIPEGEYPTITGNTIVFPDEDLLATDAINVETFDGDEDTYSYYGKEEYLMAKAKVDKNMWKKVLNVKFSIWYGGNTEYYRQFAMLCYGKDNILLEEQTTYNCNTDTIYNYEFDIPENCEYITFISKAPDTLPFKIYEIKITDYINLIPIITEKNANKNGYMFSVSDYWNLNYAWHAVDRNLNTVWSTDSGNYNEHWFTVEFPEPKIVSKYIIIGMHSWGEVPKFYLQASNNYTNWINLENEFHYGVSGYSAQTYSIQIDNTTAYKYYRIYIPAGSGWSYGASGAGYIYILKMYGK